MENKHWISTKRQEQDELKLPISKGLEFDGKDDFIEIVNKTDIPTHKIPTDKWIGIIRAKGMGKDITIVHDLNVDRKDVYYAFCEAKCPVCGSYRIFPAIKRDSRSIECDECGKTTVIPLTAQE